MTDSIRPLFTGATGIGPAPSVLDRLAELWRGGLGSLNGSGLHDLGLSAGQYAPVLGDQTDDGGLPDLGSSELPKPVGLPAYDAPEIPAVARPGLPDLAPVLSGSKAYDILSQPDAMPRAPLFNNDTLAAEDKAFGTGKSVVPALDSLEDAKAILARHQYQMPDPNQEMSFEEAQARVPSYADEYLVPLQRAKDEAASNQARAAASLYGAKAADPFAQYAAEANAKLAPEAYLENLRAHNLRELEGLRGSQAVERETARPKLAQTQMAEADAWLKQQMDWIDAANAPEEAKVKARAIAKSKYDSKRDAILATNGYGSAIPNLSGS